MHGTIHFILIACFTWCLSVGPMVDVPRWVSPPTLRAFFRRRAGVPRQASSCSEESATCFRHLVPAVHAASTMLDLCVWINANPSINTLDLGSVETTSADVVLLSLSLCDIQHRAITIITRGRSSFNITATGGVWNNVSFVVVAVPGTAQYDVNRFALTGGVSPLSSIPGVMLAATITLEGVTMYCGHLRNVLYPSWSSTNLVVFKKSTCWALMAYNATSFVWSSRGTRLTSILSFDGSALFSVAALLLHLRYVPQDVSIAISDNCSWAMALTTKTPLPAGGVGPVALDTATLVSVVNSSFLGPSGFLLRMSHNTSLSVSTPGRATVIHFENNNANVLDIQLRDRSSLSVNSTNSGMSEAVLIHSSWMDAARVLFANESVVFVSSRVNGAHAVLFDHVEAMSVNASLWLVDVSGDSNVTVWSTMDTAYGVVMQALNAASSASGGGVADVWTRIRRNSRLMVATRSAGNDYSTAAPTAFLFAAGVIVFGVTAGSVGVGLDDGGVIHCDALGTTARAVGISISSISIVVGSSNGTISASIANRSSILVASNGLVNGVEVSSVTAARSVNVDLLSGSHIQCESKMGKTTASAVALSFIALQLSRLLSVRVMDNNTSMNVTAANMGPVAGISVDSVSVTGESDIASVGVQIDVARGAGIHSTALLGVGLGYSGTSKGIKVVNVTAPRLALTIASRSSVRSAANGNLAVTVNVDTGTISRLFSIVLDDESQCSSSSTLNAGVMYVSSLQFHAAANVTLIVANSSTIDVYGGDLSAATTVFAIYLTSLTFLNGIGDGSVNVHASSLARISVYGGTDVTIIGVFVVNVFVPNGTARFALESGALLAIDGASNVPSVLGVVFSGCTCRLANFLANTGANMSLRSGGTGYGVLVSNLVAVDVDLSVNNATVAVVATHAGKTFVTMISLSTIQNATRLHLVNTTMIASAVMDESRVVHILNCSVPRISVEVEDASMLNATSLNSLSFVVSLEELVAVRQIDVLATNGSSLTSQSTLEGFGVRFLLIQGPPPAVGWLHVWLSHTELLVIAPVATGIAMQSLTSFNATGQLRVTLDDATQLSLIASSGCAAVTVQDSRAIASIALAVLNNSTVNVTSNVITSTSHFPTLFSVRNSTATGDVTVTVRAGSVVDVSVFGAFYAAGVHFLLATFDRFIGEFNSSSLLLRQRSIHTSQTSTTFFARLAWIVLERASGGRSVELHFVDRARVMVTVDPVSYFRNGSAIGRFIGQPVNTTPNVEVSLLWTTNVTLTSLLQLEVDSMANVTVAALRGVAFVKCSDNMIARYRYVFQRQSTVVARSETAYVFFVSTTSASNSVTASASYGLEISREATVQVACVGDQTNVFAALVSLPLVQSANISISLGGSLRVQSQGRDQWITAGIVFSNTRVNDLSIAVASGDGTTTSGDSPVVTPDSSSSSSSRSLLAVDGGLGMAYGMFVQNCTVDRILVNLSGRNVVVNTTGATVAHVCLLTMSEVRYAVVYNVAGGARVFAGASNVFGTGSLFTFYGDPDRPPPPFETAASIDVAILSSASVKVSTGVIGVALVTSLVNVAYCRLNLTVGGNVTVICSADDFKVSKNIWGTRPEPAVAVLRLATTREPSPTWPVGNTSVSLGDGGSMSEVSLFSAFSWVTVVALTEFPQAVMARLFVTVSAVNVSIVARLLGGASFATMRGVTIGLHNTTTPTGAPAVSGGGSASAVVAPAVVDVSFSDHSIITVFAGDNAAVVLVCSSCNVTQGAMRVAFLSGAQVSVTSRSISRGYAGVVQLNSRSALGGPLCIIAASAAAILVSAQREAFGFEVTNVPFILGDVDVYLLDRANLTVQSAGRSSTAAIVFSLSQVERLAGRLRIVLACGSTAAVLAPFNIIGIHVGDIDHASGGLDIRIGGSMGAADVGEQEDLCAATGRSTATRLTVSSTFGDSLGVYMSNCYFSSVASSSASLMVSDGTEFAVVGYRLVAAIFLQNVSFASAVRLAMSDRSLVSCSVFSTVGSIACLALLAVRGGPSSGLVVSNQATVRVVSDAEGAAVGILVFASTFVDSFELLVVNESAVLVESSSWAPSDRVIAASINGTIVDPAAPGGGAQASTEGNAALVIAVVNGSRVLTTSHACPSPRPEPVERYRTTSFPFASVSVFNVSSPHLRILLSSDSSVGMTVVCRLAMPPAALVSPSEVAAASQSATSSMPPVATVEGTIDTADRQLSAAVIAISRCQISTSVSVNVTSRSTMNASIIVTLATETAQVLWGSVVSTPAVLLLFGIHLDLTPLATDSVAPVPPWVSVAMQGDGTSVNVACVSSVGGVCTHVSAIMIWVPPATTSLRLRTRHSVLLVDRAQLVVTSRFAPITDASRPPGATTTLPGNETAAATVNILARCGGVTLAISCDPFVSNASRVYSRNASHFDQVSVLVDGHATLLVAATVSDADDNAAGGSSSSGVNGGGEGSSPSYRSFQLQAHGILVDGSFVAPGITFASSGTRVKDATTAVTDLGADASNLVEISITAASDSSVAVSADLFLEEGSDGRGGLQTHDAGDLHITVEIAGIRVANLPRIGNASVSVRNRASAFARGQFAVGSRHGVAALADAESSRTPSTTALTAHALCLSNLTTAADSADVIVTVIDESTVAVDVTSTTAAPWRAMMYGVALLLSHLACDELVVNVNMDNSITSSLSLMLTVRVTPPLAVVVFTAFSVEACNSSSVVVLITESTILATVSVTETSATVVGVNQTVLFVPPPAGAEGTATSFTVNAVSIASVATSAPIFLISLTHVTSMLLIKPLVGGVWPAAFLNLTVQGIVVDGYYVNDDATEFFSIMMMSTTVLARSTTTRTTATDQPGQVTSPASSTAAAGHSQHRLVVVALCVRNVVTADSALLTITSSIVNAEVISNVPSTSLLDSTRSHDWSIHSVLVFALVTDYVGLTLDHSLVSTRLTFEEDTRGDRMRSSDPLCGSALTVMTSVAVQFSTFVVGADVTVSDCDVLSTIGNNNTAVALIEANASSMACPVAVESESIAVHGVIVQRGGIRISLKRTVVEVEAALHQRHGSVANWSVSSSSVAILRSAARTAIVDLNNASCRNDISITTTAYDSDTTPSSVRILVASTLIAASNISSFVSVLLAQGSRVWTGVTATGQPDNATQQSAAAVTVHAMSVVVREMTQPVAVSLVIETGSDVAAQVDTRYLPQPPPAFPGPSSFTVWVLSALDLPLTSAVMADQSSPPASHPRQVNLSVINASVTALVLQSGVGGLSQCAASVAGVGFVEDVGLRDPVVVRWNVTVTIRHSRLASNWTVGSSSSVPSSSIRHSGGGRNGGFARALFFDAVMDAAPSNIVMSSWLSTDVQLSSPVTWHILLNRSDVTATTAVFTTPSIARAPGDKADLGPLRTNFHLTTMWTNLSISPGSCATGQSRCGVLNTTMTGVGENGTAALVGFDGSRAALVAAVWIPCVTRVTAFAPTNDRDGGGGGESQRLLSCGGIDPSVLRVLANTDLTCRKHQCPAKSVTASFSRSLGTSSASKEGSATSSPTRTTWVTRTQSHRVSTTVSLRSVVSLCTPFHFLLAPGSIALAQLLAASTALQEGTTTAVFTVSIMPAEASGGPSLGSPPPTGDPAARYRVVAPSFAKDFLSFIRVSFAVDSGHAASQTAMTSSSCFDLQMLKTASSVANNSSSSNGYREGSTASFRVTVARDDCVPAGFRPGGSGGSGSQLTMRVVVSDAAFTCAPPEAPYAVDIPVIVPPPQDVVGAQTTLVIAAVLGSGAASEAQATVTLDLLPCAAGTSDDAEPPDSDARLTSLGTSLYLLAPVRLGGPSFLASDTEGRLLGNLMLQLAAAALQLAMAFGHQALTTSNGWRNTSPPSTQNRESHTSMAFVQFPYWTIFVGNFLLPGTSVCSFMLLAEGKITPVAAVGALYSFAFVISYVYVGVKLAHPTTDTSAPGSMWLYRVGVDILERVPERVGSRWLFGRGIELRKLTRWIQPLGRWGPSRHGDPPLVIVVEDFTHTWAHVFAPAGPAIAVMTSLVCALPVLRKGPCVAQHTVLFLLHGGMALAIVVAKPLLVPSFQAITVLSYSLMCVSVALSLWAALSSGIPGTVGNAYGAREQGIVAGVVSLLQAAVMLASASLTLLSAVVGALFWDREGQTHQFGDMGPPALPHSRDVHQLLTQHRARFGLIAASTHPQREGCQLDQRLVSDDDAFIPMEDLTDAQLTQHMEAFAVKVGGHLRVAIPRPTEGAHHAATAAASRRLIPTTVDRRPPEVEEL